MLSPIYGDLHGFSPTILTSGTRDLFLSLTVRLHRKLRHGRTSSAVGTTGRASRSGSASVTTMHALFTRKVECKMAAAEIVAGAANPYYAAHTRRVSPAALRLPQPKLPGNSNHIARGRICRFESEMPSQTVRSLKALPAKFVEQFFARAEAVRKPNWRSGPAGSTAFSRSLPLWRPCSVSYCSVTGRWVSRAEPTCRSHVGPRERLGGGLARPLATLRARSP